MRGSVYYQSAQLTKAIFSEGAKKEDRVDPIHPHYQKIASYKTMQSYRAVWNNLFNYLKEHWALKDCERVQEHHIVAYIDYKIEYYPSKQYLQKIVSAIGKLETALNLYSKNRYETPRKYDFSIRKKLLNEAVDLNLVANRYHNRAYKYPLKVIDQLSQVHRLAATIEYEGGARVEGCSLIKKEQLFGYRIDKITNTKKGVIFTKEKGGKEGEVLVSVKTYQQLKNHIEENKVFKINRQAYFKDIRESCRKLGIHPEGTHGFRWNFAQNRLLEYAKAGYTYEQSLQAVSWEMKHNRASITEHYLG